MLAAQRHNKIIQILKKNHSLSVSELVNYLAVSEATIRRDITILDKKGLLIKTYGGAMACENYLTTEDNVKSRQAINIAQKQSIAKFAVNFIKPNDVVYIDAGTTTDFLVKNIHEKNAVYITNDVSHAAQLISRGFNSIIIGGTMKPVTYAAVGSMAIDNIKRFNFTTAFLGTNGISLKAGFTTPTTEEAFIKETVINHARETYVLADNSKFGKITPITFSSLDGATIITNKCPEQSYLKYKIILAT
ncbi:DeoR/GlpR family DNA-binding transcription regulator [Pectinatus sottacetonis]|uniref:DeoR/GlpR family DNA-binding transcription regulator n=1 Tax=Pectinatus sottacetonis TaxID=1002795 RepID=UPI0018C7296A|nr:DeoR/GlpR family DNA-binding transcription regulator [Pectinatus sottacetonis]